MRTCPQLDRQAHLDALQDCYSMLKKDSTNPRWYRAIRRRKAAISDIDSSTVRLLNDISERMAHNLQLLGGRPDRLVIHNRLKEFDPSASSWPTPEIPDWHPLHPGRHANFLQRLKDANILRGDPLPPQQWSVSYLEDDSRNPTYAIEKVDIEDFKLDTNLWQTYVTRYSNVSSDDFAEAVKLAMNFIAPPEPPFLTKTV